MILNYLLEHSANPNRIDADPELLYSSLMNCADGPDGTPQEGPNDRKKQRRMLKRLLAAGADPTYTVPESAGLMRGQTALYRAEVEGNDDHIMAKMLRRAMVQWKTIHNTPN
jgi:hypothetical protein